MTVESEAPAGDDRGEQSEREQLWLELPPISKDAPRRLLVFMHGEASSPERFAPVAVAWQLKFPGATALLLQAPQPVRVTLPDGATERAWRWYDAAGVSHEHAERIAEASEAAAERVRAVQQSLDLGGERTALIGFAQGATVSLELLRRHPGIADIVVAYAGRLARPVRVDERIPATVHLLHGGLDSRVPLVHSQRSLRQLDAAGARVTLDVVEDAGHGIGQELVTLGTTRVLQTVFRGRRPNPRPVDRHPPPETLQ